MVTANTLTATITITDPATDTVVAMLGCDPGCHGVQYGAKRGGGYYAYVSSKFSNTLLVVDPDPDGDGNPADATVAGRISLVAHRCHGQRRHHHRQPRHGRTGHPADPRRLQRLGPEPSTVVEEPVDRRPTRPGPVAARAART
jgi:hypothetical protein